MLVGARFTPTWCGGRGNRPWPAVAGGRGAMSRFKGSGGDPRYVVAGEAMLVVSALRRNSRWSQVDDDVADPLLQGFAVLKQTLAGVDSEPASSSSHGQSHENGHSSVFSFSASRPSPPLEHTTLESPTTMYCSLSMRLRG